jgi:hypothetical protein
MIKRKPGSPRRGTCSAILMSSIYASLCLSFQIFNEKTIPGNLRPPCAKALMTDVTCSPVVKTLRSDAYYPQSTLERICRSDCSSSLNSYHERIVSTCSGETFRGSNKVPESVAMISDLMKYHYSIVCLIDSGRYCNVVAAEYANATNQDCE